MYCVRTYAEKQRQQPTRDCRLLWLNFVRLFLAKPMPKQVWHWSFGLTKKLDYLDSNQDYENQNLLCCHYTIAQS